MHLNRAIVVRGALVLVAPARPAFLLFLLLGLLASTLFLALSPIVRPLILLYLGKLGFCPVAKPCASNILSNRFWHYSLVNPSMQRCSMNSQPPRHFGNRVFVHAKNATCCSICQAQNRGLGSTQRKRRMHRYEEYPIQRRAGSRRVFALLIQSTKLPPKSRK